LQDIVNDGKSVAARMSEMNAREWKGDLEKVYEYATFPDTLPRIV
jgi:glutamate--cysteine ligase